MLDELLTSTFLIEENSRNVHTFKSFYEKNFSKHLLLLSDVHWDNPKCDRKLLKKHLDEAKAKNAKIILNGDTFCLMQGAYDPRKMKSDIRPEHNTSDYFDAIVRTAVEFFEPYAENIALVCHGNHETSILKRQETDIVVRFVDLMNLVHRPKQAIKVGGYGGWIRIKFNRPNSNDLESFKIKYFHGSGGGGIVTKGMISNQRRQAAVHGADIIWTGHVHEDVQAIFMAETLNKSDVIELVETLHITTSTYKEEYADGDNGWHIERGAPPKPLGGMWLEFYSDCGHVKFRHYRAK